MAASPVVEIKQLSPERCIYRVPNPVRQRKEGAYTPTRVSIGPFHDGAKGLQAMEGRKAMYLQDFLHEYEVSKQEMSEFVRKREARVRNSYAETIDMDSNQFVEMILLDSVFLIELLTRDKGRLIDHVWRDFWLVENQLPFFILQDILNMLKRRSSRAPDVSLSELVLHFLKNNMAEELVLEPRLCNPKAKHFLDLLPDSRLPERSPSATAFTRLSDSVRGFHNSWVGHFLDLVRNHTHNKDLSITIPSATELHQAGVKFRQSLSTNLFDIQFNDGTLEIPPLTLQRHSGVLYRNLIVFEQCHRDEKPLNDYFYLMDQLINTDKDADLLIQNLIIQSWWENSGKVAKFIHDVGNITKPQEKFYFYGLSSELMAFYNNNIKGKRTHQSLTGLRFNNMTLQKVITVGNFGAQCYAATMEQLELTSIFSYAMILMILSLLTMLICIWELYHRMRRRGFRRMWERRRHRLYDSDNDLPFPPFFDIIGLLTAIGEGVCSIIIFKYATKEAESPFRVNIWPLINSAMLMTYTLSGIVDTPAHMLPVHQKD